ncbi:Putative aliphatic sulfonates transport permease protein SsuC [Ruegeria denitrificans]|uniref:Putative aliphatic sulfonates transport permease protein SsuC n=1 Tax=Ruegeria denitrificans TaxID=1715692 RepID=A0A0P1IK10_9RHOB|nr:ABC transporter permease [Ruegeria denitrificans]CUK18560.1 Putative aliphatic sulfonates transport permease protein SsuC [Ruegeria denitrificans]
MSELTTKTATPSHGAKTETDAARPSRRRRVFEFKRDIPQAWSIGLGILVWVLFFGLWELAVLLEWTNPILLPGPGKVVSALYTLFVENSFFNDILISVWRVVLSFALACAVAIPLGILMGTFKVVEAFFSPFVSAWRYLPAPSFIPLLLMWFGAGNMQKLSLLFIGVVWFLITLIMDHVKAVPSDLIRTAMTLGGSRIQILRTVVVPASLPNIMIAMRQMLAVSWTYLVIAEITAADAGIGAMMMRAKRFLHVDQIMAGILVIGILGLMFDYLLRQLYRIAFPYLEEKS